MKKQVAKIKKTIIIRELVGLLVKVNAVQTELLDLLEVTSDEDWCHFCDSFFDTMVESSNNLLDDVSKDLMALNLIIKNGVNYE